MKTAVLSDIHVDINRDYPVAQEFARYIKEQGARLAIIAGDVSESQQETLDTLTLRDFRAISELFDEGVYEAMALKNCVNGRKVYGGPSKEAVTKQIQLIEEFVAQRKK